MKFRNRRDVFQFMAVTGSIISFIASIVISLLSIFFVNWSKFSISGQSFNYSLLQCTDCSSEFSKTFYTCLSQLSCPDSSDFCDKGKNVYYAFSIVIFCEIFSVTFICFLLERLVFMFLKKDHGKSWIFYVLAPLILVSKLVELGCYFGLTESNLNGNCDADNEICNESGPLLMVISVFLTSIGGALSLALIYKIKSSRDSVAYKRNEEIMAWFSQRIFPAILISILFIGLSFGFNWISYQDNKQNYGTLLNLNEFKDKSTMNYSCISGPTCAQAMGTPQLQRYCNAFDRVYNAGNTYITMITISLLFLFLWIEGLIYTIFNSKFGISELNYVWPTMCVLFHFMGTVGWFTISDGSFSANCNVASEDTDISFCAENGAIFSIISLISLSLTAIFYCFLFYKHEKAKSLVQPKATKIGGLKKIILDDQPIKDVHIEDLNDTKCMDQFDNRNSCKIEAQETYIFDEAISRKASTMDTQENDLEVNPKEKCGSCKKIIQAKSTIVGECGHEIHKNCKLRRDGENRCARCPK
ncbi:unnamed protein product [Blepharisma stoltei]|uniref:RING-type domain-containing protein n=1 Tax=Blepharisma stoltei TaxID=1481888 RepID=A0AAU9KQQ1_9CILI|nr:unnamed protein product [Blepharisma stoltei]